MPVPARVRVALAALTVFAAAACASAPSATPAAPEAGLKLERVVMLMRHGVRPPTRAVVAPPGVADSEWPSWPVEIGLLTPHGYDAVRLLGEWDRSNWVERGLLPAEGCPRAADIVLAASHKSRTQETARALAEGMAPGCVLPVAYPATPEADVEFHPIEAHVMPIDADAAVRAVEALAPPGGMAAEVQRQAELLDLIQRALGCCAPVYCADQGLPAGCSLRDVRPGVVRNENDRPDVGEPFGTVSTVAQTFLLQYLEGMPMSDVAWGRLSRDEIERLLALNTLKFRYEGHAPYVAARAASPLARRMLTAMEGGAKLTVLVGHDTNISDLGGLLDLHWKVPSYPVDNPPPGGALGFEVLSDASGARFVRAFYRAQTMDQVRYLQPLNEANPASYEYLAIPGCEAPCRLETFDALVRGRLVASVAPAR